MTQEIKFQETEMPCICWFNPNEEDKKIVKDLCQKLVDKVKELENIGDPIGMSIPEIKELIDHLYDPSKCKKKNQ